MEQVYKEITDEEVPAQFNGEYAEATPFVSTHPETKKVWSKVILKRIASLEHRLAKDFETYKKEHPKTKKKPSDPLFEYTHVPSKDYESMRKLEGFNPASWGTPHKEAPEKTPKNHFLARFPRNKNPNGYFTIEQKNVKYQHPETKQWVDKDELKQSMLPKGITIDHLKNLEKYVDTYDEKALAKIPRLEGELRDKALNTLSEQTQTRVNPKTKEKEYLLHHGDKHGNLNSEGPLTTSKKNVSFTPSKNIANIFGRHMRDYGGSAGPANTHSAWIPESKIHHIPTALADHSEILNKYKKEKEVLVNPGKYSRATRT